MWFGSEKITGLNNPTHLYLFDLLVIWGRSPIDKCRNLSSQVGSGHESAKDVFGKDIGVGGGIVLDVIA
jgi:hypothetical protein